MIYPINNDEQLKKSQIKHMKIQKRKTAQKYPHTHTHMNIQVTKWSM